MIPEYIWSRTHQEATASGYPQVWPILAALWLHESSWQERAIGDGGLSFGPLQFYTGGGLGNGHYSDQLLDTSYNLQLGARIIGGRLADGWTLWQALQPWTMRPQAIRSLQEWGYPDGLDHGGAAAPPPPGPVPGRVPVPTSPPAPSAPPLPADNLGTTTFKVLAVGVLAALVMQAI